VNSVHKRRRDISGVRKSVRDRYPAHDRLSRRSRRSEPLSDRMKGVPWPREEKREGPRPAKTDADNYETHQAEPSCNNSMKSPRRLEPND